MYLNKITLVMLYRSCHTTFMWPIYINSANLNFLFFSILIHICELAFKGIGKNISNQQKLLKNILKKFKYLNQDLDGWITFRNLALPILTSFFYQKVVCLIYKI